MSLCPSPSKPPTGQEGDSVILPYSEINWELNAGSQTRVISILVLMEHLETISTFPDLMQSKDVGVGGLLVGYTNSFTSSSSFKLRLGESCTKWGKWPQPYPTYFFKGVVLLLSFLVSIGFVLVLTQAAYFCPSIRKDTHFSKKACVGTVCPGLWCTIFGCFVRIPSYFCLSVYMGTVIKSEADRVQFISAGTDAEQETFLEHHQDMSFLRKLYWLCVF